MDVGATPLGTQACTPCVDSKHKHKYKPTALRNVTAARQRRRNEPRFMLAFVPSGPFRPTARECNLTVRRSVLSNSTVKKGVVNRRSSIVNREVVVMGVMDEAQLDYRSDGWRREQDTG
jgi:hypothetical protein